MTSEDSDKPQKPLLYGPDNKPIIAPAASSTTPIKRKENKPDPRRRRIGKRDYLGAIVAIATLLGFAIAMVTLFPRLSVSSETPIDPSDPFSTPFRIVNDGSVPLFSVKYSVGIQEVYPKGRAGLKGGKPDCSSRFYAPWMSTKVFWPTDVYTYYPGPVLKQIPAFDPNWAPLEYADICIVITYHPWGIPINRERVYRFFTQMGPDHHLHWMQRPESK